MSPANERSETADKGQEHVDTFYWSHGPCCAGCDWWRHFNSSVGECLKSAPACGLERWAMMGIEMSSIPLLGAGHVVTKRDHRCGDFIDSFDWAALPPVYLRRVGYHQ